MDKTQQTGSTQQMDDVVYTHLGRGRLVHRLGSGQLVVEFDHGGGHIFFPGEVTGPFVKGTARVTRTGSVHNAKAKD